MSGHINNMHDRPIVDIELGLGQNADSFFEFREQYIQSNSPVLSANTSDADSDCDPIAPPTAYAKLTYSDVERSIDKYYDKSVSYSSEADVLAALMRGQHHMYSSAGRSTHAKWRGMVWATIIMLLFMTILSSGAYSWSPVAITSVGGATTAMVAATHFCEFESACRLYAFMATRIEQSMDASGVAYGVASGITPCSAEHQLHLRRQFDAEIAQIKLPPEMGIRFPVLFRANAGRVVGAIHARKQALVAKLCSVKNEIGLILHKWKSRDSDTQHKWKSGEMLSEHLTAKRREKHRLGHLMEIKDSVKKEIVALKSMYNVIHDIVSAEIRGGETRDRSAYLGFPASCFPVSCFPARCFQVSCFPAVCCYTDHRAPSAKDIILRFTPEIQACFKNLFPEYADK